MSLKISKSIIEQDYGKLSHAIYDGKVEIAPAVALSELFTLENIPHMIKQMQEIDNNPQNWHINHLYEGCFIRLFFHESEWKIGTTNTLDVYKATWGEDSTTFMRQFMDALTSLYLSVSTFYEKLDKASVYHFVLTFTGKACVLPIKTENSLIFLNRQQKSQDGKWTIFSDIGFFEFESLNTHIKKVTSWDKMENLCNNINYSTPVGISATHQSHLHCFKIYTTNYVKAAKLRKNHNSISMRYIELCHENNLEDIVQYEFIYGAYLNELKQFKAQFEMLAQKVLEYYITYFIRKDRSIYSPVIWHIMTELHDWHKENRLENKANINKITELIIKKWSIGTFRTQYCRLFKN